MISKKILEIFFLVIFHSDFYGNVSTLFNFQDWKLLTALCPFLYLCRAVQSYHVWHENQAFQQFVLRRLLQVCDDEINAEINLHK
jgi:hypothetical protein